MFESSKNETYSKMMEAYKNTGAKVVNKIPGQVRGGAESTTYKEGDIIEWPDKLEWLEMTIGKNKAYGFICNIKNGDESRLQMFYPSCLSKGIRDIEVDSENNVIRDDYTYVYPGGEAAIEYRKKAGLEMDAVVREMIKNHPDGLKVTSRKSVPTYKFQSTDITRTNLYSFDYA